MKLRLRSRAGQTLLEVMLAIFVGSILMSVLVAIMSRVMVSNASSGEHLRSTVVLARLAEQFRRDVREATSVAPSEDAAGVKRLGLDSVDQRIEYELSDAGLRRTLTAGNEVRKRDLFAVPTMKIVGWQVDGSRPGEVSLLLGRLPALDLEGTAEVRNKFPITAYRAGARKAMVLP